MAQDRYRHEKEYRKKINNSNDNRLKAWIPKEKVPAFKTLFNRIKEKVGTYRAAQEYVGLACSTMTSFERGEITKETGERIMAAYIKITKHGVL